MTDVIDGTTKIIGGTARYDVGSTLQLAASYLPGEGGSARFLSQYRKPHKIRKGSSGRSKGRMVLLLIIIAVWKSELCKKQKSIKSWEVVISCTRC